GTRPATPSGQHAHCRRERSIQAFFSCTCRRWVSRSTVGSSPASSACDSARRAVRQTASLPSTSWRTISRQSGASVRPGSSTIEDRLMNSAYEPGALRPSARMRSAVSSSAFHCSVYWSMNIACSELNIGPVTFQWKVCVFRYSVKLSERNCARSSAMALRSLSGIPMSTPGAIEPGEGDAAGAALLLARLLVFLLSLLVLVLAITGSFVFDARQWARWGRENDV